VQRPILQGAISYTADGRFHFITETGAGGFILPNDRVAM
jgi:hypothetical protein